MIKLIVRIHKTSSILRVNMSMFSTPWNKPSEKHNKDICHQNRVEKGAEDVAMSFGKLPIIGLTTMGFTLKHLTKDITTVWVKFRLPNGEKLFLIEHKNNWGPASRRRWCSLPNNTFVESLKADRIIGCFLFWLKLELFSLTLDLFDLPVTLKIPR